MSYDEKAKERTLRYLAKLKSVQIRIKLEEYEQWKTFADKQNISVRSLIIDAVNDKIKRDA